jgi:hypothetical protein
MLAVLVAASCTPPPPPLPTVLVYGDSLTVESRELIVEEVTAAHPGHRVVVRAYGGTAQCDWHPFWAADHEQHRPDVVVLAFTGNQMTPCATSRELSELYGDDARWAAEFWSERDVELVVVGAPPFVGAPMNSVAEQYRSAASATGVRFHDSSSSFVDPSTLVAGPSMPCSSSEAISTDCAFGRVLVRNPDGVHLCPVAVNAAALCPEHSAGAQRYANEIAAAIGAVIG